MLIIQTNKNNGIFIDWNNGFLYIDDFNMEPLSMSSHIEYIYNIRLKYDKNRPFIYLLKLVLLA